MHKKKRAQVTVYIILGIIILFSAILLFYFRGTTEKEMGMQEIIRAQKIPKEARPITNYVTTNLDDAAKKGLLFIGMQGGYIYQSQGGPIPDPIEEDNDFIYYKDNKVFYNIHKQNNNLFNYYFYKPKYYPWYYYPYPHFPKSGEKGSFSGFFGTSDLPPLNGSSPSIQFQLTEFITNYLQKNIDLTIFDEQGFEIDEGKINVSVIIGENDVIAFLEYPLGIKKTITNTITNVSYFYTNPQIRLKKVYNFTDFIINKDTTDILFNITNASNNDISVGKIENILSSINIYDDIIIVKDNNSMLYAEPYTFQFARENRYPALHWISTPSITLNFVHAVLTEEHIKNQINPKADDPDEDVIVFTYSPSLPYHITEADFNEGYVNLIVYVREKDNEDYSDWQELKIDVIRESE